MAEDVSVRCQVSGVGYRVPGARCRVPGIGCRVMITNLVRDSEPATEVWNLKL